MINISDEAKGNEMYFAATNNLAGVVFFTVDGDYYGIE